MTELVLSLFPGIDLLGMGFERAGFCVVRGPDLVFGGDIREFKPVSGRFDGVIGGPPCQDFSRVRRSPPTGYGLEMVDQWKRVVLQAAPRWWLMENVPGSPIVALPGYRTQRIYLTAAECGGNQRRLRLFQWGCRDATSLVLDRRDTAADPEEPCCLASEGSRQNRRGWADFCELQGLPRSFDLPGMSVAAKYRAVGNGVPVYMAETLARAVRQRFKNVGVAVCACGCGRRVSARQYAATATCRKRLQRRRDENRSVTLRGT